jgi:hypothetical protein
VAGLVGRQRELASLSDAIARAAGGHGAVLLAVGEPGIGKTRLLEAAAEHATRAGFHTAWGRAWEVSTAPPYWPWIEALRELVARGHSPGPLVELLPELGRGERSTGDTDPFRLYDAVVAFLQAASARAPIAIVLDDLHVADPSSLRLAELVAPHVRRMRAVLLGSYRDLEARRTPALETALGRVGRNAESLHLARLDVRCVGELVRERVGRDDAEAARMIHDASDGNPLFVSELLKLLAARGAHSRDVPAGVRAVIRERLALLSPATVALLQAAALVGRTFDAGVPAELAGVTPAALDEAIGEAAGAEVVEIVQPGRYRFSHALVAETLVADLSPAVRSKLHRRAAETLERRHGDVPDAPFAEIAHHWLEAGAEHAPRAVDACVRAAVAASDRLAFDDAAAFYDRALAILATTAPGDLHRRAALLVAQAEAYVRGGERGRAAAPCTQATDVAQTLGDGVMFARAALAYGADAMVATSDPVLITMLERALQLLPESDDPWRAKVTARLAAARQPATDIEGALALARDAIAMARRLGDPAVLRDVLFSAIGAFVDFARPAERAALNEELLPLLDGDTPRTLRTLQRLAFDQIELGELAGFERTVRRYEALGEATGQLRYRWVPLLLRSMQAYWQGRLDEGDRLSEEAYAIREKLGDELVPMLRQLRTYSHRGYAGADDLERMLDVMTGSYVYARHAMRAHALVSAGRLAEAAIERDWLVANTNPGALHYHLLEGLALVAWTFRDKRLAQIHQDSARAYSGRAQLVSSIGFVFHGFIDHGLMRTALVLGDRAAAATYRQSALAQADRLGARPFRDAIERDWASMAGDTASETTPAPVAPAPPAAGELSIVKEGEFWTVRGFGELCRIKDSRGMQMLARLLEQPGRELHVLDLAGADVVDGGDSGSVLDRTARDQYVARLRRLQDELAEASAWNDRGRQEKLEAELDAITEQLSSAYGLGGREKRAGSATERARTNVRRRIADAMQRIEDAAPTIGRHLAATIKTGFACVYDPARAL